ncbi:basic helix-loop-helix protein A [Dorcoceras hygrometricum]|uniref:Basic helix-loop-helix protein A n=1 Tax=Dorcoceras hygrometricum TaxID=472368 RepID=A0A2Z7AYQ0_9LAMI|nr:basic helix-loop-helix protein A [Dorcoceras hygrometricum]
MIGKAGLIRRKLDVEDEEDNCSSSAVNRISTGADGCELDKLTTAKQIRRKLQAVEKISKLEQCGDVVERSRRKIPVVEEDHNQVHIIKEHDKCKLRFEEQYVLFISAGISLATGTIHLYTRVSVFLTADRLAYSLRLIDALTTLFL